MTSYLARILDQLSVSYHQYADDTRAFLHGPAAAASSVIECILEASGALNL